MPKPTLFICGAPRAGTTSLYQYLRQHPDVCMSRRKETGVFLENYDRGLEWLASNYLTHYDGESVVGESTTGHMQHPPSARRMGHDVPEARLVFILRDPVERIYSHYRFHRQSGRLTSDDRFSALIRDEETGSRLLPRPGALRAGLVSPYWNERCGMKFGATDGFAIRFGGFWRRVQAGELAARDYVVENLTLETCARWYADIADEVQEDLNETISAR